VEDHAVDPAAPCGDGRVERVDDEVGAHVGVDGPADQAAGGDVDDGGQVAEPVADA
jgi:hypothetical protein